MEFKLVEGPWAEIFKGTIESHGVEILSNPNDLILVVVMDESHGKKNGAVLELFKAYNSVGETETFIETLPRDVTCIIKHDESQTVKFFLLGSGATYASWKEEEFSKELSSLSKKLKSASAIVNDVSKAYNLTLKELSQCSEEIKQSFFTQPMLAPILGKSAYKTAPMREMEESHYSEGEIFIGTTKDGIPTKEPTFLMPRTMISGGDKKERIHSMHIMIEGMLLSNVPVVVFDETGTFNGLREPRKNIIELKKYKIDTEPIGFPVKDFAGISEVKVDLALVNTGVLLEMFGVGKNPLNGLLEKVFENNSFKSIPDSFEKISKIEEKDFTDFQKKKAIRILKLIDLRYPEMFGSPNNISEISRKWLKGLGRTGRITLKELDERQKLLIFNSIAKALVEYYTQQGPTKETRTVIALPQAEKYFPTSKNTLIVQETVAVLLEGEKYGVGWLLESELPGNVREEISLETVANIALVKGNDAGIQLQGKKPYRTLIRPSLSQCAE